MISRITQQWIRRKINKVELLLGSNKKARSFDLVLMLPATSIVALSPWSGDRACFG